MPYEDDSDDVLAHVGQWTLLVNLFLTLLLYYAGRGEAGVEDWVATTLTVGSICGLVGLGLTQVMFMRRQYEDLVEEEDW